MKFLPKVLPFICVLAVTACGGGGSGGGSDTTPAGAGTDNTPDITDVTPVDVSPDSGAVGSAPLLTGRFVDSAVIGLEYSTATQSGLTDADGSFSYQAGEQVTFSIGDITFPAVAGADLVTPLDVFGTTNIADPSVMNMTRLLQTLDIDGNPQNGIRLSSAAIASATGLSVDFAAANFDSQVVNLVANSGSSNISLIDGETALTHFQETLFDEGVVARPVVPEETNPPAGGEVSGNNALVGTTSTFSNFAHDISGTLTLIDDRTIEISNFTYDGGGPSVFFYTGTDGDYRASAGGRLIGPMLNGRVWNGETITITLPDDITLDDFNGVSVWCDIFNANFGDATF